MISLNEIRSRADVFAHEFAKETDEKGEAAPFWEEFFQVFGVSRRRVASFEYRVKKADGAQGFIDVFWPGVLLAEHKTQGRDLDKAYQQALTYLDGLKDGELPRYVVVSDFARMRLYDLEEKDEFEFPLQELSKHIERFGFISGYEVQKYEEEERASIKAAELMAGLHNAIAGTGYEGHALEVFLTRILFCLFSEDTGIFDRRQFQHYIEQRTNEDGSDLGIKILELFYTLNTPEEKRQNNLDEQLAAFPYINGQIFAERLDPISLDRKARETLLKCCAFDWSQISAAIFGSLFQGVMDPEERRQLGAHYTSELNIMKVIQPLFLDELYTEFDTAKRSQQRLETFHNKLASLKFLDPACGCGNFLVTTYRELRKLEIEVLKKKRKHNTATLTAFGAEELSKIHVNQFYGIEIEEFPALVARTAMYLADHQMNQELSKEFGVAYARIPLEEPATIVNHNALTIDWKEVVKPDELDYILGNPPFYGAQLMTKEQKVDLKNVFPKALKGVGDLDFVTAWYAKSAEYIQGTKIKVGLVSTNSITQGQQVDILWKYLQEEYGVIRHFAHQTFKWSNEAKGNAGVYCVIIGFAVYDPEKKYLYTYKEVTSEPVEREVENINAYLADAPDVFVEKNTKPLCAVPKMTKGNYYAKSKGLIVENEELNDLLEREPEAKKYIKRLIGSDEFINNRKRYCLWLVDCPPGELRKMPAVLERVNQVREDRLGSSDKGMQKLAATPTVFRETYNPDSCLVVPVVSSERRMIIPIGFIDKDTISTNGNLIIDGADNYHFGVLTSKMHMAWVRYTCGRLESRYRYSKDIVYNNFPWPGCAEGGSASEVSRQKIEELAQVVLDIRAKFPGSSLADLYDPNTMPPALAKAHEKLDREVDKAYGYKDTGNEADRIAFLFKLYQQIAREK